MSESRRPVGTDRVRVEEDGTLILSCRHPKDDWVARRPAEGLRGDFPGTCVRWGDEALEVVACESAGVGVRYRLAPWRDDQTIRTITDYDEPTEARRAEERAAASRRETAAKGFRLGSLLVGLLPGDVQRQLESELGVPAHRATLYTSILLLLLGGYGLIGLMTSSLGTNALGMPFWVYGLGTYFWVESMVRIGVAMGQTRAIGSFPVVLVWELVAALRGKRSIANKPRLQYVPDPSETERDAFIQREPFLALLSPEEQLALERRYGFDWRRRGRASVTFLALFALITAAITLVGGIDGVGEASSLAFMIYLLVEQGIRFSAISGGRPAGSVFGMFVRVLSRKALEL